MNEKTMVMRRVEEKVVKSVWCPGTMNNKDGHWVDVNDLIDAAPERLKCDRSHPWDLIKVVV